jgi:hypothetical protein
VGHATIMAFVVSSLAILVAECSWPDFCFTHSIWNTLWSTTAPVRASQRVLRRPLSSADHSETVTSDNCNRDGTL